MKDCAVKYGAGYMDYDLFEMYNLTPEQRDTYLTRGRNNALVVKYNDKAYTGSLTTRCSSTLSLASTCTGTGCQ